MGIEIERKFLVNNSAWREDVIQSILMVQGYLNREEQYSVRIRVENESANLNIKSRTVGMQRHEYEYPVPAVDAREILNNLPDKVEKLRHIINHAGHTWEVDEFSGKNRGLVVAEIELEALDENFDLPKWCGPEITDDIRYYNHSLSQLPYSQWVTHIEISLAQQSLVALNNVGNCVLNYSVSTATNGPGEMKHSECTPRGLHQIRAKIGSGESHSAVFVGRRASGEVWSQALAKQYPDRDWILSRILWLSGCEPGKNRLGKVDSMQRYIYIHGTPDTESIGIPASHGCIRMRNSDVMELFDHVFIGTTVMINE